MFNLDAYLHRIGYSGPRTSTLETLASLHALHPSVIPFENVDPLLRRPVRLDLDSLQQKLVDQGRGGYCFEHNLLFAEALDRLGFHVRGLAARVLWNAPADAGRPRTHMLLRIDSDEGHYIADVGFGGLTLTAPLRLETGVEQSTPHETFRIVATDGGFVLEAAVQGSWRPLYGFSEEKQTPADYEMANWYTSTHPRSVFLTSLMAARVRPDARYTLLNNELSVHHRGGPTERQVLTSGSALRTVLTDVLGIRLPEDPGLEAALQRLTS